MTPITAEMIRELVEAERQAQADYLDGNDGDEIARSEAAKGEEGK
jgi:hypothetical protein